MNQTHMEADVDLIPDDPSAGVGRITAAALREQMSRDRLAQKWLAGGVAVCAILFLFLFYVPSRETLASLRARIGTDGRQLAQDSERISALGSVQTAVAQLRDQVTDFSPIPDDPQLYQFTQKVTDLSQSLGLRGLKCTPEISYTNGQLGVWPVRLTFRAGSFSTLALMREIEAMPRSLRIHELSMRRAPVSRKEATEKSVEDDQIEVTLVVNLFYKSAEEPVPALSAGGSQ